MPCTKLQMKVFAFITEHRPINIIQNKCSKINGRILFLWETAGKKQKIAVLQNA